MIQIVQKITNNINNNFTINVNFEIKSIGNENLDYLTEDEKKQILLRTGESISKYVELVNFNKYLPLNHSFCVSDLKSKYVNVFNNKEKRIDKLRKKYFFDEISQIAAKKICEIFDKYKNCKIIKNNNDINKTVNYNIKLSNSFFTDKLYKELHNNIEVIAYNNKDLVKNTWIGSNNNLKLINIKMEIRKLLDHITKIKIPNILKLNKSKYKNINKF